MNEIYDRERSRTAEEWNIEDLILLIHDGINDKDKLPFE